MFRVATVFGTRPEAIKLAPVILELERRAETFRTVNISSSQHRELLRPFLEFFRIRVDHDLELMTHDQTPAALCSSALARLEKIFGAERPDAVLVQGDTTTSLAGALAAFYARIPVGHVEAGLRTASLANPFPEEGNRRLIGRIAKYHFAATRRNLETLLGEGVPADRVALTGNPVVDGLRMVLRENRPSPELEALRARWEGRRMLVLTTHRRESFGEPLRRNLAVIRDFVERHADVVLVFPMHPNPNVRSAAREAFAGAPRIETLEPLGYADFVWLLSNAWLIVSDSGGIQEEAPSVGRPLLVLRETTERPEVIEAGAAVLVGGSPERLAQLLAEAHAGAPWIERMRGIENPFGRGDSGPRIVAALEAWLTEGRDA